MKNSKLDSHALDQGLANIVNADLHSHAYLIEGSSYDYLLEQAKLFMNEITDKRVEFFFVTNKVCDSKNSDENLSIDAVRASIKHSYLTPHSGYVQAIIFPYADTMTVPAQNALLKTLEECPENTVFVLLVQNSRKLLSTIQSRVLKIKLSNTPIESTKNKMYSQIIEWLYKLEKSTDFLDFYKFTEFLKSKKREIREIIGYLKQISSNAIYSRKVTSKFWSDFLTQTLELEYKLKQNYIYNVCVSEFIIKLWELKLQIN